MLMLDDLIVKGRDEQTLLRSIEQTLDKGDILLGDAFFPTFFHLTSMQGRGVDILLEQQGARKRSSDVRKGIKLGQRDHLITLEKPKKKPYWMSEESYGYECAQLQDAGDGAEGNLGPSAGL